MLIVAPAMNGLKHYYILKILVMKKIISFLTVLLFAAVILLISGDIANKIDLPILQVPIAVGLFTLAIVVPTKKGIFTMEFTEGLCEKVQTSMIQLFKTSAPELQRTQLGYIQAVVSDINMGGFEVVPLDQGNGKTRDVRITYIQRATETNIISVKPKSCAAENEPAPFEQIVTLTAWHGMEPVKFSETEMRKLCEPDSMYMGRVINAQFDALTKALDKILITAQASNFGAFEPALSDPGLWRDVQMLNSSNNMAPIYYGESQVIEDFTNIGYTNKPIVIGAGNLSHYVRQVGIGCCNDQGVDLNQAGNLYYFHDIYVNTLIGANHFIAMRPGSVQLITRNDYVGSYAKENQVFSHGTVTDPFTGITWDIKWHYNDCDDTYSLIIGVWYKQYFLPSNIFASDDDLYGVNGVLHYRATSSAVTYA